MASPPITALFFDLGGVLLTNGWDRDARRRASERFALDLEEFEERHHLTFTTLELGKLRLDEYLDRVVFHEPRSFGHEEFRRFMFDQSRADPAMLALVAALRSRHGLRTAVVSNESRELAEYRIRTFGLTRLVDFFVVSSFVGARKPDADIFRFALDVAQVEPARVAYLEDRPMFVDVARGLGLRAIRHTDVDSTRAALAALGLDA